MDKRFADADDKKGRMQILQYVCRKESCGDRRREIISRFKLLERAAHSPRAYRSTYTPSEY